MIFDIPLSHNVNLVRSLTSAQYPYGLTIGGVDVIGKVPFDSISITEAGPGAVSSMRCTVIDTSMAMTFADNADVRMHDYVRDLPMFLGFIERPRKRPWVTGGVAWELTFYGVEALLDTVIVPQLTSTPFDALGYSIPTGIFDVPLVQLVAQRAGVRAGALGFGTASSAVNPVGSSGSSDTLADPVTLDGKTLRSAVEAWLGASWQSAIRHPVFLSIDFTGGLRYFAFGGGTADGIATAYLPSDYATLTVNNVTGGAGRAATDLSWDRDLSPGAIVNSVYVVGTEPTYSTGWVVGDLSSGRHEAPGATQGDTENSKLAAGFAVMGSRGTPAGRGSLTLRDYTPANVHPGSRLVITDAQMGWSAKTFLITQIEKTLNKTIGESQDWTVTFFDPAESPTAGPADVMRLARTLTRGTLN